MNYAKSGRDKNEWDGASGIVLHQNTETIRQSDCDRGSVRVFEAQLASQPYGDWLSGSRNAQKAVSQFIIDTAIDSGLFVSESSLSSLGERKRLPSGESIIYENAAQGVIYKVRDPYAKLHLKSGRAIDVLYDHIAHNVLFPEAKYTLIGVTSILDEVRFILAQPFFYYNDVPTQKQIDAALLKRGLRKEDNYYYGNDYLSVTDVSASSDNVIQKEDGELLFIDPIIKIKKPIDELIEFYSSFSYTQLPTDNKFSLFDKIKSFLKLWHR